MNLDARIAAFVSLGESIANGLFDHSLDDAIHSACSANPWFTESHVRYALQTWSDSLSESAIMRLARSGPALENVDVLPKTIAIIMAGNLPLAGMHDWLCVLLSGNKALVKLSANDNVLLPRLNAMLPPALEQHCTFEEGRLGNFQAVIATGSNNTSRYFDYYFGRYPHIIRHNRNSLAILNGNESPDDLQGLCDDIFLHFGLGCRSVSKLFVPKGYCFDALIEASTRYAHFADIHLYRSSLDYHKALMLLNGEQFVDGGFWMLHVSPSIAAPVSIVNYEEYADISEAEQWCRAHAEDLQVVARSGNFGNAQHPSLTDFADGVNTMKFLAEIT
ncbi:MAG: hypothetical protein SPJ13_05025 [Bacteroidales bacterium]|nr:hypothetical protein [Bacteroidales bacterium]